MFTRRVWTDDSKLLQESNLTARKPRRAPHHVIGIGQLWVKELSKVPAWRLEWDSNLRPCRRKAPNLPVSNHVQDSESQAGRRLWWMVFRVELLNCSSPSHLHGKERKNRSVISEKAMFSVFSERLVNREQSEPLLGS